MSDSVTGFVISSALPGGQNTDGDSVLTLQAVAGPTGPTVTLVRSSPRNLSASYVVPGAMLLGAGPGASRGLSGAAVPPSGEPYVGYSLHATLEVVPPAAGAPIGTMSQLRVASGAANTVVGLDANANANVPGGSLLLGGVPTWSRNSGGQLIWAGPPPPDTGDANFVQPAEGSGVVYTDGGNLKIA